MKKILLILILVFMASPVYAFTSAIQGVVSSGGVSGGETCQTTPFYDSTGTVNAFAQNAGYTADQYSAGYQNFNPASNKSICKIEFVLTCPYGSCASYSYYAAVYTMDGNNLGDLVGAASDARTGSNAWADTTVAFDFSTYPTVSNGTNYGLIVYNNTQGENQLVKVKAKTNNGFTFSQWASSKTRYDATNDLECQVKVYAYE
jgi:hypothetical protein